MIQYTQKVMEVNRCVIIEPLIVLSVKFTHRWVNCFENREQILSLLVYRLTLTDAGALLRHTKLANFEVNGNFWWLLQMIYVIHVSSYRKMYVCIFHAPRVLDWLAHWLDLPDNAILIIRDFDNSYYSLLMHSNIVRMCIFR
jgi:hypothetical protein